MMKAETWLDAERQSRLGFADECRRGPCARGAVSRRRCLAVTNVTTGSESNGQVKCRRTQAQRDRLRHRLQLIAMQARFGRDPKRDEEDRERGARHAAPLRDAGQVEAIKADDRKATRPSGQPTWSGSGGITTTTGLMSRTDNVDECKYYAGLGAHPGLSDDGCRRAARKGRRDRPAREGVVDPEHLAEAVAAQLAPQLEAARRAMAQAGGQPNERAG